MSAQERCILVAEDELAIRRMTAAVLSRAGYTVLEAENGRHALEIADRHAGNIDLLITDINMPEMDGHELARELKGRRPTIDVMIVSARDQETFPAGATPYAAVLTKPFSLAALVAKVRELTSC